jgi:membrane protein YdbS with pleckstrin-like domain
MPTVRSVLTRRVCQPSRRGGGPVGSVEVVTEPFDPPGEPWVRVSPRLATVRRLGLLFFWVPVTAVAVIVLAVTTAAWLATLVAVTGVALLLWGWLVVGRTVRAWGYAERADDLLVTKGVLNRQLVVVPYGRMQFVDVSAGPLDRRFGLATVQLHTAAAATDASIPGLVPEEAARLRDRLAARGEATAAGL